MIPEPLWSEDDPDGIFVINESSMATFISNNHLLIKLVCDERTELAVDVCKYVLAWTGTWNFVVFWAKINSFLHTYGHAQRIFGYPVKQFD